MHVIEHTYRGLLADVSRISGHSEIRGSGIDLQWCINDAPKLEKKLLRGLEESTTVDFQEFPVHLRQLARESLVDPLKMRCIRQLLLFCYKAYIQHDNKITTQAFRTFESTNEDVRQTSEKISNSSPRLLNEVRRSVQSVLYRCRFKGIVPFHGPGASTTPKGRWSKWYHSIESVYPCSDYMTLYYNSDHVAQLGDTPTTEHISAKLIAVPKDSRGPRLICVHPAEAIWFQQGLRVALERAIEQRRYGKGPWPCGHVHFDDQGVNGKIALLSSKSRIYATLDMKEASDRLSETLVQVLFGPYYKYFGCCRAQKYYTRNVSFETSDDNIHCYAPMGNATTFPVQSLVFWAICCASLQRQGFHQPGAVYVFGDDIIVPTAACETVINDLESFGLVVNRNKSFWRSHFRESCGIDAFNGVNVTPVRWKCGYDIEGTSDLLSLSDLAMRLRMAGYEDAATELYYSIRIYLHNRYDKQLFLTNNPSHGGIAEYTCLHSLVWRDAYWHRDLQKFVSPIYRLEMVEPLGFTNDWNHVLESVTSLMRSGRSSVSDRMLSRASMLKRGWTDIL